MRWKKWVSKKSWHRKERWKMWKFCDDEWACWRRDISEQKRSRAWSKRQRSSECLIAIRRWRYSKISRRRKDDKWQMRFFETEKNWQVKFCRNEIVVVEKKSFVLPRRIVKRILSTQSIANEIRALRDAMWTRDKCVEERCEKKKEKSNEERRRCDDVWFFWIKIIHRADIRRWNRSTIESTRSDRSSREWNELQIFRKLDDHAIHLNF